MIVVSSVVPNQMVCTPTIVSVTALVLGVVLDGFVFACSNSGVTIVVVSGVVAPIALVGISVVEAIALVGDGCIGAICSGDLSVVSAVTETVLPLLVMQPMT